jgi:hypothetical protein
LQPGLYVCFIIQMEPITLKELKNLSKAGEHQTVIAMGPQAEASASDKGQLPFIHCAVAYAHMRLGQPDNLKCAEIIFIERLSVEKPKCRNVPALNGYAELQELLGNRDIAVLYYQRSFLLEPKNEISRKRLVALGVALPSLPRAPRAKPKSQRQRHYAITAPQRPATPSPTLTRRYHAGLKPPSVTAQTVNTKPVAENRKDSAIHSAMQRALFPISTSAFFRNQVGATHVPLNLVAARVARTPRGRGNSL